MKVRGKEEVFIRAQVEPGLENQSGGNTPVIMSLYSQRNADANLQSFPISSPRNACSYFSLGLANDFTT